ncbi:unnamed protein product [Rotaria sp. Silwood2]|nr:unnamed protein product [Rotaria sp. Silwood2]CAF3066961.1 unnamed protein product [Rotaria sp. Silwood2]
MSSNGSRAQLKAFYECSFEDNCHLPLDSFLQLRTTLIFANYNHTNLIQRLDQFYGKSKTEVYTYFHADTLTSTLNAYCGDMNQFDKEIKATVYTCNGPQNIYCNSEKKMKEFLSGVTLTDYIQKFFGWR